MSSPFRRVAVLGLATLIAVALGACHSPEPQAARTHALRRVAPAPAPRELRVCADPNNLPFSNDRLEGFENRLASMVAAEMGAAVRYTWWAQRRGFIRNTLNAKRCDVVVGLPSDIDMALTTKPYYRSTYVFVTRSSSGIRLRSLDDPRLRRLRVGVQIIGNDHQSSPPAHALAARRIVDNVVGYSVFGDYDQPNPPAAIVGAVANGDVDAAIVWGPVAGFFARQQHVPLILTPVSPQLDMRVLPLVFDISMAVRHQDRALRDELDRILARRRADIARLLDEYGVPRVDGPSAGARAEAR